MTRFVSFSVFCHCTLIQSLVVRKHIIKINTWVAFHHIECLIIIYKLTLLNISVVAVITLYMVESKLTHPIYVIFADFELSYIQSKHMQCLFWNRSNYFSYF